MEKVLLMADFNITGKTWIAVLEEGKIKNCSKMYKYEFLYFFYFRVQKCLQRDNDRIRGFWTAEFYFKENSQAVKIKHAAGQLSRADSQKEFRPISSVGKR